MIPFFKTAITGHEEQYVKQVLNNGDSFARRPFVAKCEEWFKQKHQLDDFFLTKSCSSSLELAAMVIGIKQGDEVILPSYAFVACGNAFALRGATCVFVDIAAGDMNIDATKIEQAITPKTKAIVTLNYGGVACNYEAITKIAKQYNLYVIEDNAHGTGAKYGDKYLGTYGDISCFSFDHLKNISCGQGGGIAINNKNLLERFFVSYEFGTNRRAFFKGNSDRYEWKAIGSNFPLSELNAAMLYAQLENCEKINNRFVYLWNLYFEKLSGLAQEGKITLPKIDNQAHHNGHCFFIKTADRTKRNELINFLLSKGINAQFHYTPLHSSEFGKTTGWMAGEDTITTSHSQRLLRLPLFYSLTNEELNMIVDKIKEFYS